MLYPRANPEQGSLTISTPVNVAALRGLTQDQYEEVVDRILGEVVKVAEAQLRQLRDA